MLSLSLSLSLSLCVRVCERETESVCAYVYVCACGRSTHHTTALCGASQIGGVHRLIMGLSMSLFLR